MVVSYTFTIESTGGNGIVVPGWGFLLNNELTDFNYDDVKHPNAPQAGKRPRSSMAPTYVERNGRPFLALGSPGGAIDHHHGAAEPRQPGGSRQGAARRDRRRRGRASATPRRTQVEPAFATTYSALTGLPAPGSGSATPVARRARASSACSRRSSSGRAAA